VIFELEAPAWYAIGLAIGFFLYLTVAYFVGGRPEVRVWLG
jgi:hypothetical protein